MVAPYPPAFDFTVRDGQLALVGAPGNFPVIFGVSSAGSAGTVYLFTDGNEALDTLGYGPLTEVGLPVMEVAGGALFVKLAGSVAAANSAVTTNRIASSVGTLTISGAAYRDYRWQVEITSTTAALGSGKFRYTLDNANTWSEEITIPAGGTYSPAGSGITWTFALQTGSPDFEDGDVFSGTCTCAHWNTTNLSAGTAALLASPYLIGRKIQKVFFTGIPDLAATAATNAAAIATFMASLENIDHFARAMMDCGSLDTSANVLANYVAAFSDTRVAACYGRCESTSPAPIGGYGLPFVSILKPVAVRATDAEISENLGRSMSGPLRGVKPTTLSQNEELSAAFTADNKIITLRTDRNKNDGAYVTNGFLKSPVGSDFQYWDYGVTLDRACEQLAAGLALWKLAKLVAMTDGTGYLHPLSAAKVHKSIATLLRSVMEGPTKDGHPQHISGQSLIIATAYDFIATRVLKATYKMVPLVPVEGGSVTVGLTRELEA